MENNNIFKTLYQINVNEFTEKKGKLTYLSWAHAVAQLLKHYPASTWEIVRFDNLPYLKTEQGYFVEVAVTVEGITRSSMLPVMDNRNQPIKNPSTFDINTSQQRALAKAISLHGLGLYIYAGEDLPEVIRDEIKTNVQAKKYAETMKSKPELERKKSWAGLNDDEKNLVKLAIKDSEE